MYIYAGNRNFFIFKSNNGCNKMKIVIFLLLIIFISHKTPFQLEQGEIIILQLGLPDKGPAIKGLVVCGTLPAKS